MSADAERRRWRRLRPVACGVTSHVRLRTGRDLLVRDMSSGGARVEGATRLLPGTHSEVHVIATTGRQLVRSRIVWARVLAVDPLTYEAALLFDVEVGLLVEGYCLPSPPAFHADRAGSTYPSLAEKPSRPRESQGNTDGVGLGRAFEVASRDSPRRQRDGDD